jgi:UDP-N-acetylmuramoyl-L-alanyl-D-glutamate--2,6-diaminopimelate ligase
VSITESRPEKPDAGMRPEKVTPQSLAAVLTTLPPELPRLAPDPQGPLTGDQVAVAGVTIDSRCVRPGDLYIALPGARSHGAAYGKQAVEAGAVAVLTDSAGLAAADPAARAAVPFFCAEDLRRLVGPISAVVFGNAPGSGRPALFAVTGTNGKTTTTYFLNALLAALGKSTGLIGTIEISAGGERIPSALTTPESPQIHGLLALMREKHIDAAAMEVSSHALAYRRVDSVVFDVAGFTNLTQDHLDLHGSMESYFATKAELFQPDRARRAVITVDDDWGRRMAAAAGVETWTLAAGPRGGAADWRVEEVAREGLGHTFALQGPDGVRLWLRTGLPGLFNVSNAALAAVMVAASGVPARDIQAAVEACDPFSAPVPGRMQLIAERPAAVVDFAHNPDALARSLESVRPTDSTGRLIVVFGATGERDRSKRPAMGAVAARTADVVIITDDDPHDEDAAAIRREVLEGALHTREAERPGCEVREVFPRAEAIDYAVSLARPEDTVLVAGRGHEVWQEINGVNHALDDRVELAAALTRHGFSVLPGNRIES